MWDTCLHPEQTVHIKLLCEHANIYARENSEVDEWLLMWLQEPNSGSAGVDRVFMKRFI